MMKRLNILLILYIVSSPLLRAQNDTVFLTGTSRFYGDSLVLRWNGRNLTSFNALQKIPVVVERMNPDGRWLQIAQQNAVPVNRWYLNRSASFRNRLLAAGLLQQFQTESKRPVNGDEESQQRQENLKYLWLNLSLTADLDAFVAEACNLRHTILNPPQNSVSQYRIFSAHPLYFSDTLFFVVAPQKFKAKSLPAPAGTEQDGAVSLRWKTDRSYTAYYVEKAAPGSGTWTRINTAPLVIPAGQQELFYTDSVQNYVPSEYRISGIDLFGDATLPGAAVKAMSRDRTPPPVLSGFKVQETSDKRILLSWDKPLPLNGEAGIAIGIKHEGADAYRPLFNKLKPITTTSFTVPVKPGISNYYFVLQVFDTAGNSSSSEAFIQLEDNTAPAKPEGLRAIVNDSGIVTLRWNSNKESDLRGYLIYFSNSPKTEFSGLVNTPLEDTLYFDTLSLRMLNRDVYYGIEAVDHRMNRSGMTAMVKVLRPDTLPPVEPVFRSYQVGDSFIRLVWFPSSSIDVTNQLLTRQNTATGEIITLKFKPTDSSYTDDALEAGQLYKYNLFALDESNNRSPIGTTLELKTYRNTFLNPVKGFNAVYDSLSRVVIIRWEIPELPAKKTIIYKGSSPETVSATPIPVKVDEHEAFDLRPKTGTTYYSVKIMFENGKQTLMCKPVGVTVR